MTHPDDLPIFPQWLFKIALVAIMVLLAFPVSLIYNKYPQLYGTILHKWIIKPIAYTIGIIVILYLIIF